ncbi:conserved hypothetical protein [Sphingomonas sp. EC-HK361]|uniref:helix-turn-helix domain-containing protein n=1 Tax=Sphingomonas sp. EC-HK361 TaxID=2038397 RepID=UPI00125A1C61|nr:helix-turn-helix transcriptional regulator [Sphingomonas sp. EC-HK361]VVT10187.1 conserved hypothetical protein [Sphingomonas sp. EC-HK361]
MARINSIVAKLERQKMKLSLDDLARRAGVDRTTLHRIETGRMKHNAEHVVARLAKVFRLEPEQLTATQVAEVEIPADDTEIGLESPFLYRSQLNVRVPHEVRNALHLVAWRYGMRPLDIIEIAPLLFHVVAAETLKQRSDKLASLRDLRSRILDMSGSFPHLHERMLNDWNAEEIGLREERSITARDLRGDKVDEGDDYVDARPLDYDDSVDNPFVAQLRHRLDALQPADSEPELLYCWSDGYPPRYEICREEALAYLGGDADAGEEIVTGRVGLHEIPKELRDVGQAEARATWVKERAAELGAKNAAWLETLGLGELGL